MALQPIQQKITQSQLSFKQKKAVVPYLDATENIETKNNVKPLPGQGHLVHDTPIGRTKYIFKDIGYSLKSVKDGIKGTANDHELGRINDFGLRLTGLGIATYLATKTNDPKTKVMEFVGLAMFLLSMDIYPKLVINLPARIVHGFDIDKQYIDDQGRKKSVFQDSNYIPYDLYRGEAKGEDIDEIGDRMGIPRDIVNRHDVIKEKMRKVATQNNTLWMLTAGFATPAITALACSYLEGFVTSGMENIQNHSANNTILKSLKDTANMVLDVASIPENKLSKEIKSILVKYDGKEIPQDEINKITSLMTSCLDNATSQNISKDIKIIFDNTSENAALDKDLIEGILKQVRENLYKTKRGEAKYKNLIPNIDEVMNKLAESTPRDKITQPNLITAVRELLNSKTVDGRSEEVLDMLRSDIMEELRKADVPPSKKIISKESIDKINDFAKIIGDFKEKFLTLDKCASRKFAYAPGTVLACSYEQFTKTMFKELGISYKDIKKMIRTEEDTKAILDKKFEELCKDETKYKKTMERLGKVVSDMEIKLNGGKADASYIKDLITAYENLYNNTAKRLDGIGFKNTADILVKEDINTLGNSITSISELFDLFDGTGENKMQKLIQKGEWKDFSPEEKELYKLYETNGVGSAKRLEINAMVDRYQGAKNNFNRIMHTLDLYKRAANPESFSNDPEYAKELVAKAKEVLLSASPSDYTMKLGTNNNPNFYRDLMSKLFEKEVEDEVWSPQTKCRVTQSTKDALSEFDKQEKGDILTRFQKYLTRFRNIIANNPTDFTKPEHTLDYNISAYYTKGAKTDLARYNLAGSSIVSIAKDYAGKSYLVGKWRRIIGATATSVVGVALLSQLRFGRILHPENIKKQVKND